MSAQPNTRAAANFFKMFSLFLTWLRRHLIGTNRRKQQAARPIFSAGGSYPFSGGSVSG
jgi:hypothetical protein